MGTFWRFSSRLVAVMMISVWSGALASACACFTGSGGEVTSVAFVPGAGDWPVVCGCIFCASAGVASAVEASKPRVSARFIETPIRRVTALRQRLSALSIKGRQTDEYCFATVAGRSQGRLGKHRARYRAQFSAPQGAAHMEAI